MKLSLGPLLLALALLAPAADAQVSAGRYTGAGVRAVPAPGGYASSRIWVPGRYETVEERVWVPGRMERVWAPARYDVVVGPCGLRVRVLVEAGHWRSVHRPGHYEIRHVRVWRPGAWVARGPGC